MSEASASAMLVGTPEMLDERLGAVATTLSRSEASDSGEPRSRLKICEKVARFETLKKHKALICQCSSTGSRPSRNVPSATPRR